MTLSIGEIYTMDEAAEKLRVSRRSLQDLVKLHPYYATNGKKKLFSEQDILSLWEAMRCHSKLPKGRSRRTGSYVAPSTDSALRKAQKLLTKN